MCKIKFEIKKAGPVSVRVVDIIGKHISSFVNNYDFPGQYELDFNDESLMPGRYYYKIFDWHEEITAPLNGIESKILIQSGTLKIGESIHA